MGIFTRGTTLWILYRDADGKRRRASTGYLAGDEGKAQETLAEVERTVAEQRAARGASGIASGGLKLRTFAERWLKTRATETADDDRGRFYNHIAPALGDMALGDIRPRHVRDFVDRLKATRKLGNMQKNGTRVATAELIAPRTVLHVYGTLRAMLNDAVADELIAASPCVLKDELPLKRDKDRTWRRTAVFTRDEVETIISAPADEIPEDRRVMYAVMFLGAMRFGEAAALTWRDYDASCSPLAKLVVERSYSSKSRKVKGTKTENPREMPVHPTLARILAEWKLGGFERLTGRRPAPGDLVVPSRRGKSRNVNHMLRRFHEDLERVGLRARRQHDSRRTFISLARADGARPDILRWATHGPSGDIVDDYTTLPWATLCDEVAKLRIAALDGKLVTLPVQLPRAANGGSTQLLMVHAASHEVSATTAKPDGQKSPRIGLQLVAKGPAVRTTARTTASNVTESLEELAERTGLEPAASGVTGRRYNQLNYRSKFSVGEAGFEPATSAV